MVLQAVQVTSALPFAHGEVVEQVVATGLGCGGGNLCLREYPLEALDGELAHVLNGVAARHDDVHARETTHRAYVDHMVLGPGVAEPRCHEVLHAVNGCRCHCRLLVGLGDPQVERCESLVFTRHIDAGFQTGVVDCKALYNFHN